MLPTTLGAGRAHLAGPVRDPDQVVVEQRQPDEQDVPGEQERLDDPGQRGAPDVVLEELLAGEDHGIGVPDVAVQLQQPALLAAGAVAGRTATGRPAPAAADSNSRS